MLKNEKYKGDTMLQKTFYCAEHRIGEGLKGRKFSGVVPQEWNKAKMPVPTP